MKRLLKNSIYVAILAVILVTASRTYETPRNFSGEIKGNTPLEKAQSLVELINKNQDYDDFAQVSLKDFNQQDQLVVLSVMVSRKVEEIFSDQPSSNTEKFFGLVGEIFNKVSRIGLVKEIRVEVRFTDVERPLIFFADKERLEAIKEKPGNWLEHVIWPYYLQTGSEKLKTPTERITALVDYLSKAKDFQKFARVTQISYVPDDDSWRLWVTVFQNASDVVSDESESKELFMRFLEEIFVKTAQLGESKKIWVAIKFPETNVGEELVFLAEEISVEKIKRYPRDWNTYVIWAYPISAALDKDKTPLEKSDALVFYFNKKHEGFVHITFLGYQEKVLAYSMMFVDIGNPQTIQLRYTQVMGEFLKNVVGLAGEDEGVTIQTIFPDGRGELYPLDSDLVKKIKDYPRDWQVYAEDAKIPMGFVPLSFLEQNSSGTP